MNCNAVSRGLAGALALVLFACAGDSDDTDGVANSLQQLGCATDVPASLTVPDSAHPDFTLAARGVQVYACKQTDADRYEWTFVAPDARLFEARGRPAGHHYAGPTWKSIDGSSVKGSVVASERVDSEAIPWLLLRATAHDGDGRMARVRYVQRLFTVGGLAPSAGCDATHLGAAVDVPYTASYAFFR